MKLSQYHKGSVIIVNDKMQHDYIYVLSEEPGTNFREDFKPHYTPQQMLEQGVFEGKYLNDCTKEFPEEWFKHSVSKRSTAADPLLNKYQIKSRMSLQEWQDKGWIIGHDPRGWFQWYCRYWLSRRDPIIDDIQIKRWKAYVRHAGQIKANCSKGDITCRPKQRQGLLQWAYDDTI